MLSLRRALYLAALIGTLLMPNAHAAAPWPGQTEGDWVLKNYKFANGEVLPELKLHYMTLGSPKRDPSGRITNAALILHGSSGTGKNWLQPWFADEMFG